MKFHELHHYEKEPIESNRLVLPQQPFPEIKIGGGTKVHYEKYDSPEWPLDKDGKKNGKNPNIKFKNKKSTDECKNTLSMIEYVTKQTNKLPESEWRIYANFDWQKELENQKKENKLNNSEC